MLFLFLSYFLCYFLLRKVIMTCYTGSICPTEGMEAVGDQCPVGRYCQAGSTDGEECPAGRYRATKGG